MPACLPPGCCPPLLASAPSFRAHWLQLQLLLACFGPACFLGLGFACLLLPPQVLLLLLLLLACLCVPPCCCCSTCSWGFNHTSGAPLSTSSSPTLFASHQTLNRAPNPSRLCPRRARKFLLGAAEPSSGSPWSGEYSSSWWEA